MKTVPCTGCRKPIVWRWTPNEKRMPLDPEPLDPAPGTYVIEDNDYCRPSEPLMDGPEVIHRMNHWVSCTSVDQFKRRKS